jgi:hypothetical protein
MIVRIAQADDHVALCLIVADTLNEAAAIDVSALKRFEIKGTAIFHVNGFRANLRSEPSQ